MWIVICIGLAIVCICIKNEKFRTGKRSVWIHISGWQIVDLGLLSSLIVTRWRRWRSRLWWSRFCCQLSVSVGWRWTCDYAPPVCLQILCSAIFAGKASVHVVLTKQSWVPFYCSLYHVMPRWVNSPLLLFSDFGTRFLDSVLCWLYCRAWNTSFGHFGHIHSEAHVGLFQLDLTSLRCHSISPVVNMQEMSGCL